MIDPPAGTDPTEAMDDGPDSQRELDSNVGRSRRDALARNCCAILLMPMPENRPAELDIAQNSARDVLHTDLRTLSNNRVMRLLQTSGRVVDELDDHSSATFLDASWGFTQQVVLSCATEGGRWRSESWCRPRTLLVGEAPVVVLDTKDWIELAKPEHETLYRTLREFAATGVRFPVSETALEELLGGASREQRRTIVPVIEGLGCSFVVNLDDLWQREIECALDTHVGPDRMSVCPLAPVPFVTDVFGAWRMPVPRLRVMRDDEDVTQAFLRDNPDRADALREAEATMPDKAAKALLGDTPKTSKWRSLIAESLLPHYAKAGETYGNLPANVRSRFLRRLAAILALNGLYDSDALAVACLARGKSVELLREGLDAFGYNIMAVVPSFDAFVMLTMELIDKSVTERRPIAVNDLQDARHLAMTVPYADFVMTDRGMATHWRDSGLAAKARAEVLHDLDQLANALERHARHAA